MRVNNSRSTAREEHHMPLHTGISTTHLLLLRHGRPQNKETLTWQIYNERYPLTSFSAKSLEIRLVRIEGDIIIPRRRVKALVRLVIKGI